MLHLLPPEVQEKIYKDLKVSDLQNLACCSYKFDGILKQFLWVNVKVKKIHLLDQDFNSRNRLKNLKHAQRVRIVAHAQEADERKSISRNFNRILKYCNPKVLHACLNISDVLDGIVNMCNLTALYLDGTCTNDSDLLTVCDRMTSLKLLSVRMTDISDYGLAGLQKLALLEFLDVGSTKVSHHAFKHLKNLIKVEELYLDRCTNILNTSCLTLLSSLGSLKNLKLSSSGVDDSGVSSLSCLIRLNALDLSYSYNKITGRSFANYTDMKQLTKLELVWCGITDANVVFIARISSLQHLDLRQNPITDTGVKELRQLDRLEFLDVSGCREVTSVGMLDFSTMVQLKWLGLSGTNVTEKGMKLLMKLRHQLPELIVERKY